MAVGSGIYVPYALALVRQTPATPDYGLDWRRQAHKVALLLQAGLTDANLSTDASFAAAPYTTAGRQVPAGGGYTSGGANLNQGTPATPTAVETTNGRLVMDAGDVSWPSSTIVNARAALIHAADVTVPAVDPPMVLLDFGAAYSTSNGTFTVVFHAQGAWYWDTRGIV